MKKILLAFALLFLIALEILRVYFIMPFPGSQRSDSIDLAYFLQNHIGALRIVGLLFAIPLLAMTLPKTKGWWKVLLLIPVIFYLAIFYLFNFRFLADKMFYQPSIKTMSNYLANSVDTNSLVLGVSFNGQQRAYPIQIIGYHHQVRDTVGGVPVMVTYCTVCRTGRVYSPVVDGRLEEFRLVGMDHFNAMFEDQSTKSWWRQVTGEAIAGPSKGKFLQELPSRQMRLGAWLSLYPQSLVMQPDSGYKKQYAGLQGYDSGTIKSSLEKRDSSSWKFKSWVIGITAAGSARAYDWNTLVRETVINDTVGGEPVLLALQEDGSSFHAYSRRMGTQVLTFTWNKQLHRLEDNGSHASWNWSGRCMEGPLKDSALTPLNAYQEFWHSWSTFHPRTTKYP